MDPLVLAFGEAAIQSDDPKILARRLFNIVKNENKNNTNTSNHPQSLELELWGLCVFILDNDLKNGLNPNEVISWLVKNIEMPTSPIDLRSADPNASLDSQSTSFADRDQETFFKYIFELVLMGDLNTAKTVAEKTNNWLVGMALNGYGSSQSQMLVRDSCLQLSKSAAGVCERAFYGLLSMNINACIPLCSSWEQLLLAYMRCGSSLNEFQVNAESNELHSIILSLILGEKPVKISDTNLLRVRVHLQLLFNYEDDGQLAKYTEQLLTSSTLKLIPKYISVLSSSNQASVYGNILYQIVDAKEQNEQLLLTENYPQIPIESVLLHLTEIAFGRIEFTKDGVRQFCSSLNCIHQYLLLTDDIEMQSRVCPLMARALNVLLSHKMVAGAIALVNMFDLDSLRQFVDNSNGDFGSFAVVKNYYVMVNALDILQKIKDGNSLLKQQSFNYINDALEIGLDADSQVSVEDVNLVDALRKIWIPILVFEYLNVLDASDSEYALDLAVKLADEEMQLYKLFDGNLMESLVKPILNAYN